MRSAYVDLPAIFVGVFVYGGLHYLSGVHELWSTGVAVLVTVVAMLVKDLTGGAKDEEAEM